MATFAQQLKDANATHAAAIAAADSARNQAHAAIFASYKEYFHLKPDTVVDAKTVQSMDDLVESLDASDPENLIEAVDRIAQVIEQRHMPQ